MLRSLRLQDDFAIMRHPSGKESRRLMKRVIAGFLMILMLALCCAAAAEETETVTYKTVTVNRDTEYVDLGKISVTDWRPFYAFLQQLPNLKKVDMYGTVINLRVHQELKELFPDVEFGTQIRLKGRRFRTDITAFSTLVKEGDKSTLINYDEVCMLKDRCKNLYALDIGHNKVRNLDFLYEMPELRVLIVALCDVTDITPISSLKHLEYLEIFHNKIEDLSPLKDLPYLMDLDIVRNKVTDLTPLAEIKSLQRLWIYWNNYPDAPDPAQVAMLQEALPNCHIDYTSTSTGGGWRKDPHYDVIHTMFLKRTYKPFADSKPENMPEPWRSERMPQGAGE